MLLSDRSPERKRQSRITILPFGGLLRTFDVKGQARRQAGGRAGSEQLEHQHDEPGVDPLYLFACGLSWRKQGNASAGWELARCLKAPGQTALIASAFLEDSEDIRPPVRDRVRARDRPGKPAFES